MTELSPAAQAVLDAAMDTPEEMPYEHDIAAALRAAAEHLDGSTVPVHIQGDSYWPYRNGRSAAAAHLLTIAAELEGSQ